MDKSTLHAGPRRRSTMTPTPRFCWCLILLLLGHAKESEQLVIKSVNVPATVKATDTDYVILDCDYDLEDTPSKGLVVKWFFNTNELAYQWIYDRLPLAGELASKYIDLTYKASDDPLTQYRAMKLNKPGVDLTGEYTCSISTYADERSANASMVVYSTEDKFDLVSRKKSIENKDGVEVTCLAEGLYPQPIMEVSVEGLAEKQVAKPDLTMRDDGLYDILSRMTLLDEELPESAIVKCALSIPRANYNVSRQTVYYPGISTTTSTTTTKLLGKAEIQSNDSQPGNGGGNSAFCSPINFLVIAAQLMVLGFLNL